MPMPASLGWPVLSMLCLIPFRDVPALLCLPHCISDQPAELFCNSVAPQFVSPYVRILPVRLQEGMPLMPV